MTMFGRVEGEMRRYGWGGEEFEGLPLNWTVGNVDVICTIYHRQTHTYIYHIYDHDSSIL